jgi:uncharacterized membrane protein
VTFAHPIPAWLFVVLVALAATLAVAAYARAADRLAGRQRALLSGLRFVTLVALVVCLLRPVVPLPPPSAVHGLVAVVVDTSASMGLRDEGGRSRLAAATSLVQERLLPGLGEDFEVEVLTADAQVERADAGLDALTAEGRLSDLSGAVAAVQERFRDRSLAAIVLLSDGADTAPPAARGVSTPGGAPVYTVGVGARAIAFDREVRSVTVGPSVLDASLVDLSATLVGHGARGAVPVRVLHNGRVIEVRDVTVPADGSPVQETFTVAPDRGAPGVFRVEIAEDTREVTLVNNRVEVLVPPPGRRRRVLLLEGAPGFDHTFLKRALQLDPSIEIDSVVRKGRNDVGQDTFYVQASGARTAALSTGFPSSREALFTYDTIVLANTPLDAMAREQLESLADFVAVRGGGLLVFGSRAFGPGSVTGTALDAALPLDLTDRRGVALTAPSPADRLKVGVTDDGARHPIMRLAANGRETRERWLALPALAGVSTVGSPRPGAAVLAVTQSTTGATVPLVAVQRYGGGRTFVFAGEGSWRWRMLMPADDRSYEVFWRQSLRWLASDSPEPLDVGLPASAVPGVVSAIDVRVRDQAYRPIADAEVRVSVRDPNGVLRDASASAEDRSDGQWTAAWRPESRGVHRVIVEARRGDAIVGTAEHLVFAGSSDPEYIDPRLHDAVLRRLAEESGGRYLDARDAGQLPALLREGRTPPRPREFRDLWHNGWAFAFIIGLLSGEWALRRRWGLR